MSARPAPGERDAARDLAAAIGDFDGVRPINESADLVLAGLRPGGVILERDGGEPVGFGVFDSRENTIMLGVAPAHRGRGIGTRLLESLIAAHPDAAVWAFGSLPAADALATAAGLAPTRRLLQLARPLHDEPVSPFPVGYRLAPFRPEDAAQVVAVNAVAFADHPEQGRLTVREFVDLTRQPWFSADGLLLAWQGEELAGFHWTKRHDVADGEVYVLAVHPAHGGVGLGRALLESGLAHLERIGCSRVFLYVEADRERVVRLYRSASFEQVNVDTSYRRQEG